MGEKQNERASIEPGTVVQLKSGGPKMVAGKTASDSVVSCYWANDMGSYSGAFPADCLQAAESLARPEQLKKTTDAEAITSEQAQLLKLWRATYFDGGAMREAFLNVLRLRLWGHEIRKPELLQLAETDITTDTISLLEALTASPDET